MKRIIALVFLLKIGLSNAQSAWPSGSWASAVNLTNVISASGLTELSGLHWNPQTNRYVIGRSSVGEATFTTVSDYFISTAGNDNSEGFAVSSKCPDGNTVSAWLCRDVESMLSKS